MTIKKMIEIMKKNIVSSIENNINKLIIIIIINIMIKIINLSLVFSIQLTLFFYYYYYFFNSYYYILLNYIHYYI